MGNGGRLVDGTMEERLAELEQKVATINEARIRTLEKKVDMLMAVVDSLWGESAHRGVLPEQ